MPMGTAVKDRPRQTRTAPDVVFDASAARYYPLRTICILAFALLAFALCGCAGQGSPASSSSSAAPATSSYYVFESVTLDGYTVTDPSTLTLIDGEDVTVLRQVEDPPVPFK